MDKSIKNYKIQKKLLLEAIVQKDHMEIYESPSLKNDFVLKLGEPRYELHKLELTIARTKLKLDMMQTCIKFQIPMDTQQIDRQLEKEFEKHDSMLKSMKKEIDNVHNLSNEGDNTIRNTQELKELYFSISSYVHPELVDNFDKNTKRIWKATKKAYEKADAAKLKRLLKKVVNEYKDTVINEEKSALGLKNIVLKAKTAGILSEIDSLKKQFPFNEAKILEDDAAVSKFREDIDIDIKIAKELLDKLEKQILEKLPASSKYLN
ncbi:MAG: hypothetical protein ACYDG2_11990 [Ruminiclostridium sp.]